MNTNNNLKISCNCNTKKKINNKTPFINCKCNIDLHKYKNLSNCNLSKSNISALSCNFKKCGLNKQNPDSIQPRCNEGFDILNPNVIQSGLGQDFTQVSNNCCAFYSSDPRLIRQPTKTHLHLDKPAYDGNYGNISLNEDFNKHENLTKINDSNYQTYSDINYGQITYYIDKNIQEPYFKPNFTNKTCITHEIFEDPMGSIKPQYNRKKIYNNNKKNKYNGNLSWLEDSLEHREDLMSLQMRKINQERWSNMW